MIKTLKQLDGKGNIWDNIDSNTGMILSQAIVPYSYLAAIGAIGTFFVLNEFLEKRVCKRLTKQGKSSVGVFL